MARLLFCVFGPINCSAAHTLPPVQAQPRGLNTKKSFLTYVKIVTT